ncbi:ERC protein 2-like, partial [Mizuhopecten yessoensis]|uniref:ERC protein 2-like n=1 Tax=Mizuhopecten yessoensis TaxID=6573 RepID=UPI000B45B133
MSFCAKLGVNLENIYSDNPPFIRNLTNGSVLEIFNHGKSINVEIKKIVAILGKVTKCQDINTEATTSKLYRLVTSDKSKRGVQRESFREQNFTIPVSTATSQTRPEKDVATPKDNTLEIKLAERREKVKYLTEKTKQLKRKLQRRDEAVKVEKEKIQKLDVFVDKGIQLNKMKVQKERLEKLFEKSQTRSKHQSSSLIDSNRKIKSLQKRVESTEIRLKTIEKQKSNLERENMQLKEEKNKLTAHERDLEISNDYLQALLKDEGELIVYNEETNVFSNELVECAMNLTDMKVAAKNVGPVIKEVASLCGKEPNRLPSRQTVDSFNDRKVAVSQKQLSKVLPSSKDTTLYTDETRKFGHTFQSYIVTDEEDNSYLLGLREMQNKSAKCTLDTLKEILSDISNICKRHEDN